MAEMADEELETDYLVVGAGAAGMAFTDALLAHSGAAVTIVDRRLAPGGHRIDAYPYVRRSRAGRRKHGSIRSTGSGAIAMPRMSSTPGSASRVSGPRR